MARARPASYQSPHDQPDPTVRVARRRLEHGASVSHRAVRRQRLRGPDLRGRLAPAPATGDRLVGRFPGRAAGDVHGRHVPRQPAAAALRLARGGIRCASTPCSSWASASSALLDAVRHAAHRQAVLAVGRPRRRRPVLRAVVAGGVPAAADAADGRDAAGHRALGRDRRRAACRGWASSTAATSPGAVFGCLLAGFYLLRVHDMATATYVAVALNVTVAVDRAGHRAAPPARAADESPPSRAVRRGAAVPAPAALAPCIWRSRFSGHDGAGRRGGLDAPALADARRDGLHVLDHPGRVPDRPGDRQQPSAALLRARASAAARRAGLVPVAPDRGHRLDRCDDLARRCPTGRSTRRSSPSPWYTFQLDLVRCALRDPAGRHPLGRELSAGARRRSPRRARHARGWSDACTRPTRSAPSSARWCSACC